MKGYITKEIVEKLTQHLIDTYLPKYHDEFFFETVEVTEQPEHSINLTRFSSTIFHMFESSQPTEQLSLEFSDYLCEIYPPLSFDPIIIETCQFLADTLSEQMATIFYLQYGEPYKKSFFNNFDSIILQEYTTSIKTKSINSKKDFKDDLDFLLERKTAYLTLFSKLKGVTPRGVDEAIEYYDKNLSMIDFEKFKNFEDESPSQSEKPKTKIIEFPKRTNHDPENE